MYNLIMKLTLIQKKQIAAFFRNRPEVAGVYLYGSQAKQTAGNLSDIDLGVILTQKTKTDYLDLQLEYIGAVSEIVTEDLAADIKILDKNQPLIYQAEVINHGQLIVNNRPDEVKEFIRRVSLLYPDFYPVLQHYFAQMNERLEKGTYGLGS